MLRTAHSLLGGRLHASDGNIGHIADILVDDKSWRLRYLVVSSGLWLAPLETLLPVAGLHAPDPLTGEFSVDVPKEAIVNAPRIDEDPPLPEQKLFKLHNFFGIGAGPWVDAVSPPLPADFLDWEKEEMENIEKKWNPHLQSAKDMLHYQLEVAEGIIGWVKEIILDDKRWKVRYLVSRLNTTHPKHDVLIAPNHIREIIWGTHKVCLDMSRSELEAQPEYAPGY